jgi:hypothetical protein
VGLAIVLLAIPAKAAPRDFTIVAIGKDQERRIGSFHYLRDFGRGRSWSAAVRAFGRPTSRGSDVPGRSNICTVRWRHLGLDIGFASRPGACKEWNLRRAAWYGATVHSRTWRTAEGLRIGDSVARLKRLYPRAKFHDRPPAEPFWSLLREQGPPELGILNVLTAVVWDGHVVSFGIPPNYIF